MIFKSNKGEFFNREEVINFMMFFSSSDLISKQELIGFYNSLSIFDSKLECNDKSNI